MYPEKEMLIFHVESSLHAGAGASIGHIDNPLQREKATNNPIVQANGVKGALREFFEKIHSTETDKINAAFGTSDGNDGAGAVSFGEARLLFFPVRSLAGVFAYVTCPTVVARFQRDLAALGKPCLTHTVQDDVKVNWNPNVSINEYSAHSINIVKISEAQPCTMLLEEWPFKQQVETDSEKCLEKLADYLFPTTPEYLSFKTDFIKRAVVLNDSDFFHFVQYSTEVEPHNRIGDKGTVDEKTGVWYTEYLPSESILYSPLFIGCPHIINNVFSNPTDVKTFIDKLDGQRTWLGGDRTTGKGRVMMHLLKS